MNPVDNVILLADSYKVSHHAQYPPGTTKIFSYFESRGGRFPYTVFFGLQYILKRWLVGQVVTREKIDEAKKFFAAQLKSDKIFNEEGWNYILEKHGGRLPIKIKAVAEGSVVPTKNVLFTVENTDPNVPWITSYFETILVQVWYPMTVATNSRIQKQIIYRFLQDTHDSTDFVKGMLHDAGYRGVSSVESAALGGAGHIINFESSDTIAGILLLQKYYNATSMPAFSLAASEHSTVTSWGRSRELEASKHIMKAYPEGIVAVVCDAYDVFKCVEEVWCKELYDQVISRGSQEGGMVAIRPDSGDPSTVVIKILEILGKYYPVTTNDKGYKLLPHYLKVIQGDGISYKTLYKILNDMKNSGWSAFNVFFGSGGSLIQKVDRDTQKCAYKCSYAIIDGEGVDIFKQPVTDPGKTSKKGILTLERDEQGNYKTMQKGQGDPTKNILQPVFEDGKLLLEYDFEDIRKRAEISSNDIDIVEFMNSQMQ